MKNTMPKKMWFASALLAVGGLTIHSTAYAQSATSDPAALERLHQTTIAILDALVEKGVMTREAVEALLAGAGSKAKAALLESEKSALKVAKAPETVRVPYIPETVKREIKEQLRQEVLAQAKTERWGEPGATPDWLDRIQVEGDVRIRYQTDRYAATNLQPSQYFDSEDVTNFAGLTNSNNDVGRFRTRARLAVTARLNQEVGAGIRLSTGNQNGPVSTSSTAGDPSNRFGAKIDRAYIRYSPFTFLTVDGGRITNPFFSTELIYAPDMGFDGLAVTVKPDISETVKPFLTAGAFPVRQNAIGSDKIMRGFQLGGQWQPNDKFGFRVAVGQYKISNAAGVGLTDRFDPEYNASEYESGFRQRGNTLFRINQDPFVSAAPVYGLASDFNVRAVTVSAELAHFDPIRIMFTGESVVNKAFNVEEVAKRVGFTGIDRRNKGYLYRVTVGQRRIVEPRDWQISFGARKLERDATLDAFSDPDFVLGGTNVRGQVVSLSYGIARNTELGLRFLSGRTIDPPISNTTAEPLRIKTLQLDLSVRF